MCTSRIRWTSTSRASWVAERLRSAEAALPPNLPKPELGPISSGLGQIFIYYLQADRKVADTEGKELNSYLRELNDFVVKRQLQTVPGVTAILSMGGHVLQYQVQLNPELMRKYDVSYDDVVEAIDANNRNVGGQYIEIGAEEYLVRGIGMLKSLDDIRNLTVREIDGVPLKLGEIAKVEYGPDVRRGVVTRNGEEEVVAGIVLKLHGENTSRVIHALHEKLAEIGRGLPKGITIVPYYDQADLVDNASRTVENALFQGILLVLAVLAVALWNFRASLIVALSMPFCASLAIIGLNRAGLSANLMSLGGHRDRARNAGGRLHRGHGEHSAPPEPAGKRRARQAGRDRRSLERGRAADRVRAADHHRRIHPDLSF